MSADCAGSYSTAMIPGLIVGYHGCDAANCDDILRGKTAHLSFSENPYDWLGSGIYCWENSYSRAWEWAERRIAQLKKPGLRPAVLGILFRPGTCLDLTDSRDLDEVDAFAHSLNVAFRKAGVPLPENSGGQHNYDCFLINSWGEEQARKGKVIDTVRGAFPEGVLIGEGKSAISRRTHIQWAIRNTECIVGYFRPCRGDEPQRPD